MIKKTTIIHKYCAIILSIAMLIIACCPALSVNAAGSSTGKVAKAIYGTPTIDGTADAIWANAEIQYLTHVFQDDQLTTPSITRFRTMWDENYVYFLIDVKDETMGDKAWENKSNGSNLWKRDSISFTFDPKYSRNTTSSQVAPSFWYILGAYGNVANFNSSIVSQNVWISEDGGTSKMFAMSYYSDNYGTNYGYTIECKVNLKLMHQQLKMEAGTKIGFDMYNNNNNASIGSSTRNYGLIWGGSVNSYKNDAEKGTIEFAAKGVKFTNTAEALKWDVVPTNVSPAGTPQLSIDKHTLTLKDKIWLVYFVNSKNIPENAERGMLIWDKPQEVYSIDSTTTCGQITYRGVQTVGKAQYDRYEYKNVTDRDMTTDYYAIAYAKIGDKIYYSAPDKYSVLQYAFNQTQKSANDPTKADLISLLEGMMDKGAASQIQNNHNTNRLANDTYYQVKVKDGTLSDGAANGLYKNGESITLKAPATKGKLAFSHWVNSNNVKVSENATATITAANAGQTYTAKYVAVTHTAPTLNELLAMIPPRPAAPTRTTHAGDNAYQLLMENTTDSFYKSYTATLVQNGFKEVSNRKVNNNLLGVYTSDKVAVTIYYTPATSLTKASTRLIVEPIWNYYAASTDKYQKAATPLLTMVGRQITQGNVYLGVVNDYGLMCFLIRLSDGRFIVVDGGISDNAYGSFSDVLYTKMLEQALDKNNITIAAWIFTHSHGDHIGGFCSFVEKHSNKVTIESIMHNLPSKEDHEIASDDMGSYNRFLNHVQTYCSNVPMYKVHTGHVYTIADAKIEIFYTHEDIITKDRDLSFSNLWNNSSLIFKMELGGQKIMFLGDSQEIPNDQTAAIFGSALKSDIVQVAHHGGLGGTNDIYTAVDPKVALFTTSDEIIPKYMTKFPANSHLVNNLHLQEYYNAHNRIYTWKIPYTPKSSGFVK